MKKLNILYWTSTILFALFMGMTGVQNILMTQASIDLITTELLPTWAIRNTSSPFLAGPRYLE